MIPRAWLLIVALIAPAAGCADLPRDPEGTLGRVRGGRLRVGLVEQPPWVVHARGGPAGVEVELVRRLAAELGARPEWVVGGEQGLMEALERYELDLVVGGLTSDTPWRDRVGLAGPYYEDRARSRARKHVFAAPPGENGWIRRVEEFLDGREGDVRELLQQEPSRK